MTDFEYALYTAVSDNESATDLMAKDKLSELVMVLTQTIRQNASIDWTIKESERAKLKIAVKCNREYGYHNDMQLFTNETVVKQAEMIANELYEN